MLPEFEAAHAILEGDFPSITLAKVDAVENDVVAGKRFPNTSRASSTTQMLVAATQMLVFCCSATLWH